MCIFNQGPLAKSIQNAQIPIVSVLSCTINMSAVEIRKSNIGFRLRLLRPLVWQIGNELKLSIAVEESVGCLGYEINGISHVRKGSFKQKSLNGKQNLREECN